MREPSASAAAAAEILDRLGGRWALVGALGDRIDILLPAVAYQEVALDRAQDHVITAEDGIVHKLIAWRPRDRNDIASILEAGHDLDEGYIAHWAGEWDVADRWDQARAAR